MEDQFVTIFGKKLPLYIDCKACGSVKSCRFITYGYAEKCIACKTKDRKNDTRITFGGLLGKTNITAFGIDKATGKEVALNENGDKVDVKETKYDLKGDPRGWKATGQKYRETDKYGRKNNS